MKVIAISGSTGFIGSSLSSFFKNQNVQVIPIERKKNTFVFPSVSVDVVIHLAGEPIFGYWTKRKKEKIYQSRVLGTKNLVEQFKKNPPKQFICASAAGIFGDRPNEELTETSKVGDSFLASVCRDWEKEAFQAENYGVKTTVLRLGVILGKGGFLKRLISLYQWNLGGKIGNGEQYISWLSIDDLIRIIQEVIDQENLSGIIHATSPYPVQQKKFSKELAQLLEKKEFLPLPQWLLKALFGEMANELLLSSQKVIPKRLLETNFPFKYPHLDQFFQKVIE